MSWVSFNVTTLTTLVGNSQFPAISQCRDDVATLRSNVVD